MTSNLSFFFFFRSLLFRSIELSAYLWFYERFNWVELPWNNPWTWVLGMIGVDFGYYWVHRCGHGKHQDSFSYYRKNLRSYYVMGLLSLSVYRRGPSWSWSWSYGSWIYNCLHTQLVPSTTDVVGLNLDQNEVCNIMW